MVHVREDDMEDNVDYSLNLSYMSTMDMVEKFKTHLEGIIELVEIQREQLEVSKENLEGNRVLGQELGEARQKIEALEIEAEQLRYNLEDCQSEKSNENREEVNLLNKEISKLKELLEEQKGVIDNYETMVMEEKVELTHNNLEYKQLITENDSLTEENAKLTVKLAMLEKEKRDILMDNKNLSENFLRIEEELKSVSARGAEQYESNRELMTAYDTRIYGHQKLATVYEKEISLTFESKQSILKAQSKLTEKWTI